MLYYGDRRTRTSAARAVERVERRWRACPAQTGLARHAALVAALVEAGLLAQGLADAAFQARGIDAPDPAADAALDLCRAIARELVASWDGLRTAPGCSAAQADISPAQRDASTTQDDVSTALRTLRSAPLPEALELRTPEGYAHYAVYPEWYVEAARELAGGPWIVIGIRSIGTSLAALVGAALAATRVVTVRPVGHPYERTLALSDELRASLHPGCGARSAAGAGAPVGESAPARATALAGDGAPTTSDAVPRYAVVDEGPGRSGSSFLSVVSELESSGVESDRIHLFPSHRGAPGAAAADEARFRWSAAQRHVRELDDLALAPPRAPLLRWIADAIPELSHAGRLSTAAGLVAGPDRGDASDFEEASIDDLSAGRWRRGAFTREEAWPPVFAQEERRKFLVVARGARWLAEFVGVGPFGEARHARARVLAEAGMGPPLAGLRHGFLVRPWIEGVPASDAGEHAGPGLRLELAALSRYLALRVRAFPARAGEGAPPDALAAMLRVNAVEALGEVVTEAAAAVAALAPRIAPRLRPIAVDGKLEGWEWLRTTDGRLLKTDGFQHADGHDLAGAQDVAWDVAGAVVELGLDEGAAAELSRRVELDSGVELTAASMTFHEVAYLALRVARWTFAAQCEGDPAERSRIEVELERYRTALRALLSGEV